MARRQQRPQQLLWDDDVTTTTILVRWRHRLSTVSLPFPRFLVTVGLLAVVMVWRTMELRSLVTLQDDAMMSSTANNNSNNMPQTTTTTTMQDAAAMEHQQPQPQQQMDRNFIVYLSQGPASSYQRLQQRFSISEGGLPNALFFYHSYDQECIQDDDDNNNCIFLANTTLPQGRNLVLKRAFEALLSGDTAATAGGGNNNDHDKVVTLDQVKYFVMMDDDVEIQCIPSRRDCWWDYHTMLLDRRTEWPLLAPKFYVDADDEPMLYHTCRDDSLWVMRWDYVHLLYPFPRKHETKTWNIYVQAVWERLKRCFPNGFQTHKGYRNVNPRHGEYPKGVRKGLVVDLLNEEYPSMGPWEIQKTPGERPFRCTPALQEPPEQNEADPRCMALTKSRFERWISGTLML